MSPTSLQDEVHQLELCTRTYRFMSDDLVKGD